MPLPEDHNYGGKLTGAPKLGGVYWDASMFFSYRHGYTGRIDYNLWTIKAGGKRREFQWGEARMLIREDDWKWPYDNALLAVAGYGTEPPGPHHIQIGNGFHFAWTDIVHDHDRKHITLLKNFPAFDLRLRYSDLSLAYAFENPKAKDRLLSHNTYKPSRLQVCRLVVDVTKIPQEVLSSWLALPDESDLNFRDFGMHSVTLMDRIDYEEITKDMNLLETIEIDPSYFSPTFDIKDLQSTAHITQPYAQSPGMVLFKDTLFPEKPKKNEGLISVFKWVPAKDVNNAKIVPERNEDDQYVEISNLNKLGTYTLMYHLERSLRPESGSHTNTIQCHLGSSVVFTHRASSVAAFCG